MSPSRRRAMARCAAWHPAPSPRTLARPVTTPSPAPVAIPQTHYPCGAMGTSHPTALTPAVAHRHPRNSHAPPRCPFHGFQHATLENLQRRCGGSPLLAGHPGLCVPIHPVPSLFVFLCVKNTRPPSPCPTLPRITHTPSVAHRRPSRPAHVFKGLKKQMVKNTIDSVDSPC